MNRTAMRIPILALTVIILATFFIAAACSQRTIDRTVPTHNGHPVMGQWPKLLADLGADEYEAGIQTPTAHPSVDRIRSIRLYFDTDDNKNRAIDEVKREYDAYILDHSNPDSPHHTGTHYVRVGIHIRHLYDVSRTKGIIEVIPDEQGIQGSTSSAPPRTERISEIHGLKTWHLAGITGRGIQVGIIDKGFANFQTEIGPLTQHDITALCFKGDNVTHDIADCEQGGNDHGTRITKILLANAPDVQLFISNAENVKQLNIAANWMTAKRNDNEITEGILDHHLTPPDYEPPYQDTSNDHYQVKVILHSTSYQWDGPGDGTSTFNTVDHTSPLRTADSAIKNGAVWVNNAGNSGESTWYSTDPDFDGEELDFSNGSNQTCNSFTADSIDPLHIQLRWNGQWDGQNQELTLKLLGALDDDGNRPLVAESMDQQQGESNSNPFDIINITPSRNQVFCAKVFRQTDTEDKPDWIQLSILGTFPPLLTDIGNRGQGGIQNPAESSDPGLIAVGVANPGDPVTLVNRSARGPAPEPQPNRRIKPDVTAATTPTERSTSFSAPTVAAIATILSQAMPSANPATIANYIRDNAIPQSPPQQAIRSITPPPNPQPDTNNFWGHGLAFLPQPPPPTTVTLAPGPLPNLSASFTTTAWDAGPHNPDHTAYEAIFERADINKQVALDHVVENLRDGTHAVIDSKMLSAGHPYKARVRRCVYQVAPSDTTLGAPVDTAEKRRVYTCGDWSPYSKKFTLPLPHPPLAAAIHGNQSITNFWNHSLQATRYLVEASDGTNTFTTTTTDNHAVIDGLTNGTEYTVRVRAQKLDDTPTLGRAVTNLIFSDWSNTRTATPSDITPTVSTPRKSITSDSITLSLDLDTVPFYKIRQWDGTAEQWRRLPFQEKGKDQAYTLEIDRAAGTATISGLIPRTFYTHDIRAINANRSSDWLRTTTLTKTDAPDTPQADPTPFPTPQKSPPSDLSGFNLNGEIRLSWTRGHNPNYIEQNVLRRVAGESPINWTKFPLHLTDFRYTDTTGTSATTYIYRVEALKANGEGGMTNPLELTIP